MLLLGAVRLPLLAFLSLLAACAANEPARDGIEGQSHVEIHELPGWGPPQIDILLVVDDTTAMAPYRDQVALLPSIIADAFPSMGDGLVDLHIGMITNDGALRRTHPNGQPFVAIRTELDLQRTTNFQGTLEEALGRLTSLDALHEGASTPLAAVQHVLDSDTEGFVRENAPLGIVFMTATDDASPGSVLDYAASYKAAKSDPASIIVTAITAQPVPRLDELFAAFPHRNKMISIDDDYRPVFELVGNQIWTILPGMCWRASDVDPVTPGPQYDCTVTATIDGEPRDLPPCQIEGDQLCWRLVPSNQGCIEDDALRVVIPPYHFYWFVPPLRVECVVR